MQKADFCIRNNLPAITRRFRDVADLSVKRMETELANKAGKVVYKDYITAIRDYLVPFFGKHHIDKIKYDTLDDFDVWRTAKMGRLPSYRTVHTHNGKAWFSGISQTSPDFSAKRFTVSSPLTAAMTILPSVASIERSTTSKSPS